MKYAVTNIIYDTDGEDIKLPQSMVMECDSEDFEPALELADMISDITGFCVETFNFERIE